MPIMFLKIEHVQIFRNAKTPLANLSNLMSDSGIYVAHHVLKNRTRANF